MSERRLARLATIRRASSLLEQLSWRAKEKLTLSILNTSSDSSLERGRGR